MLWRIVGLVLAAITVALGAVPAGAITIYPIDRAQILAGSRFDLKVEFDAVIAVADAKVTIDGVDPPTALGRTGICPGSKRSASKSRNTR